MKRTAKRLIAAALLLCMVLVYFVPTGAEAASTKQSGERYNIMLVIDGSGSLNSIQAGNTDPNGMRYELINELMGILEEDGHSIGAVVFSGTTSSSANPTDAEMEECLMLDTGMMDLGKPAPDGSNVKDYLVNAIVQRGVEWKPGHGTDIGTALLVAEKHIQKKQAENGQKSFIFLFTDGNTGFTGGSAGVLQKSEENRDKATLAMSQNDIHLFGAFLNNNSKLDDSEMKRLVCAANGINASSVEFEQCYIEVKNASVINEATNKFLQFLGYTSLGSSGGTIISILDDYHGTFNIPGLGVEEVNIWMYTPDGSNLPDISVTFTDPNGNTAGNVARRSSRTFQVYKIVDPQPGLWHVDVEVPQGNKIEFVYNQILSLHVESLVESNPAAADICVNMTPEFKCLLTQSGNVVTDPNAYIGYNCELQIMNSSTGEIVKTYPVLLNSNGELKQQVPMDTYGYFEAKAVFTCGNIVVESEPVKMDLTNRTPVSNYIPTQKLKYGLFQPDSAKLDLTAYFSDPEDGINLNYTVSSTTCNTDGFELTGGLLTIARSEIGDGEILITATDSQGASVNATIHVNTTNVTVFYIIALIVLVVVIAVLIILKIKRTPRPDGTLSVNFDMPHNGKSIRVDLDLPVPGTNTVSKTNLCKLLQDVLRNEGQQITTGLYARDVASFLMNYSSELSSIQIKADVKKKGGRNIGAVGVKHGKKSTVLYDSFADYFLKDTSFTIEFKGVEEDEDMFGNDSYIPASGNQKYNPFDDDFGDDFQPSHPQNTGRSQSSSHKEQSKSDADDFNFF